MDDKTPGADETEEIPPVDDTDEEIPGADDTEEIPGVNDNVTETTDKSDEAEVEEKSIKRTSGTMNLRKQPRKEYNRKS